MKLYQKILATGVVIAALGVNGCSKQQPPPPKILEGIVKEEFGDASRVVESSGALSKDITYGLVLETNEGTYTIKVEDNRGKPVFALAKAIEPGDRIKITYNQATQIGADRIGTTLSTTIEVKKGNQ